MNEEEIKIFINSVLNYFQSTTGIEPKTGVPYIKNEQLPAEHVIIGAINISGDMQGCVYFACGPDVLDEIVVKILGETSSSESHRLDMVGEIANTIAGNARRHFGPGYLISIPAVSTGGDDALQGQLKDPAFVIPIDWNSKSCSLVVGVG